MYTGTLDPASNREDFQRTFEVLDTDTGDLIDISAAAITFALREQADDQQVNVPAFPTPVLEATVANAKITVVSPGAFQVWFTESEMSQLMAAYYDVGCTITVNGLTSQLIAATLPVVDGIVSA